MKITEVRIYPTESKDGKLKAFATMTFDDWFVVRNVKVIQGTNGLFVAMPSRKAMDSCPKCHFKNTVGSKFCNQCGSPVAPRIEPREDMQERESDHMDIAHPITQECRVYIQDEILAAYNKEVKQGFKPAGRMRQGEGTLHLGTNTVRPRREEATASEKKETRVEKTVYPEDSQDIEL